MFNRLHAVAQTGITVYAVIRNAAARVWDGVDLVAFNPANWSSYAVFLAESGTSGWYSAAIPTGLISVGTYHVAYHRRMTASPLITDPVVFENYVGVGVAVPRVDAAGVVNLPSIPTGWITASGIASGALDSVWSAPTRTLTVSVNNIGPGADLCTLTFKDINNNPIADADVWISTDPAGANVVAGTRQTNSAGQVQFMLDVGNTYYVWMQKDGMNPILGQQWVAST